jgi:hypothetical protein
MADRRSRGSARHRYRHVGEGVYRETEVMIQRLLMEKR